MHKGWISTNQQFNSLKNKNPEKKIKIKMTASQGIFHTPQRILTTKLPLRMTLLYVVI